MNGPICKVAELKNEEVNELLDAIKFLLKKYSINSYPVQTLKHEIEEAIDRQINRPVIVKLNLINDAHYYVSY